MDVESWMTDYVASMFVLSLDHLVARPVPLLKGSPTEAWHTLARHAARSTSRKLRSCPMYISFARAAWTGRCPLVSCRCRLLVGPAKDGSWILPYSCAAFLHLHGSSVTATCHTTRDFVYIVQYLYIFYMHDQAACYTPMSLSTIQDPSIAWVLYACPGNNIYPVVSKLLITLGWQYSKLLIYN